MTATIVYLNDYRRRNDPLLVKGQRVAVLMDRREAEGVITHTIPTLGLAAVHFDTHPFEGTTSFKRLSDLVPIDTHGNCVQEAGQ
ncbi:hypothetical protein [Maricaulis maris]|uniref:hypothetical protein n=1 Tax=Maricaulis maris TaxID=74318 RepID=UPI003B8D940E